MDTAPQLTVQQQIREMLLANETIASIAEQRVYTRPLKRAGDMSSDLLASAATPDAFETTAPMFVKPSIVVSMRIDRGVGPGTSAASSRYATHQVTLAFYGRPGARGELAISQMNLAAAQMLYGRRVVLANGDSTIINIPHFVSGITPAPEFPEAALVMIERIELVHVMRRS